MEAPQIDPRGALTLVGAALSFSTMSALVKVGGHSGLPAQEMVLARAVVTLALTCCAVALRRISPWGKRRALLVVRGLLGFGALTAFFLAVTRLPLAEVTVIHFLHPLVAALLAALLIGEPVRAAHVAGIALSIGGVLLVTRPAALLGPAGGAAHLDPWGIAAALTAATLSAAAYVTVRRLNRTEDPLVIVFWFSLIGVPAAIPLVVPVFVWPHGTQWLVLAGIGAATQAGQVLLTRGLGRVAAGPGTAIGYVQIVFATLWGWLLFGELPDGWTLGGATAVIAGVIVVVIAGKARDDD